MHRVEVFEYAAKMLWLKSENVMSMIGYILGLGMMYFFVSHPCTHCHYNMMINR